MSGTRDSDIGVADSKIRYGGVGSSGDVVAHWGCLGMRWLNWGCGDFSGDVVTFPGMC